MLHDGNPNVDIRNHHLAFCAGIYWICLMENLHSYQLNAKQKQEAPFLACGTELSKTVGNYRMYIYGYLEI